MSRQSIALDWLSGQNDGPDPTTALSYGYDLAGRLRGQSLPGGTGTLSYGYDLAGRPTSLGDSLTDPLASPSSSTSSFTYTATDLPLTDTLPAGITLGRQYDADNRLTQAATQAPGFGLSYGYGYAPQGQITTITTTPGTASPQVENTAYDALGRLSTDLPGDGSQTLFRYDPANNLSAVYAGPSLNPLLSATYAYTYAAIGAVTPTGWLPNELVAVTSASSGQTTSYGYDASGDTTDITTTGSTSGPSYTLYYDAAGRLRGGVRTDSSTNSTVGLQIGYNARGLRAWYTVAQAGAGSPAPPPLFQERFAYQGTQVSQVIVTGTATTPFTETFLYRPDGAPLELLDQSQDGQGHNVATVR